VYSDIRVRSHGYVCAQATDFCQPNAYDSLIRSEVEQRWVKANMGWYSRPPQEAGNTAPGRPAAARETKRYPGAEEGMPGNGYRDLIR
jgi:hypothetical protein